MKPTDPWVEFVSLALPELSHAKDAKDAKGAEECISERVGTVAFKHLRRACDVTIVLRVAPFALFA